MMTAQNSPLIFGKMADILSKIEAIGKDQNNSQQNFKYRGIDDVYNAINPILAEHRVFMTSHIIEKTRDERQTKSGGVLAFTCLRMQYTFWAEDGSNVSTEVEGEGMDSGDKSSNKAMSVAHKYALLQAFCIPTKDIDDPDAETHEVAPKKQTQQHRQTQQAKAATEEDPFAPAEPAYVKDAKAILHSAKTVKPDEWFGFMDGLSPRLEDIKKANIKTYNHVIAKLGEIEASWEIEA